MFFEQRLHVPTHTVQISVSLNFLCELLTVAHVIHREISFPASFVLVVCVGYLGFYLANKVIYQFDGGSQNGGIPVRDASDQHGFKCLPLPLRSDINQFSVRYVSRGKIACSGG